MNLCANIAIASMNSLRPLSRSYFSLALTEGLPIASNSYQKQHVRRLTRTFSSYLLSNTRVYRNNAPLHVTRGKHQDTRAFSPFGRRFPPYYRDSVIYNILPNDAVTTTLLPWRQPCNAAKPSYIAYRTFGTQEQLTKANRRVTIASLSTFTEPNNLRGLQCLMDCLRREAKIVIPTFLALLASSALISVFPTVVGAYINNFSVSNVPSIMEGLGFVFFSAFASFMKSMLSGFANTRVARRMREDLYQSLLKKDISFFDTTSSGRLSSVIGSDVAVSSVVVDHLCQTIRSSISFFAGIFFSLKLAPVTLIGHTMLPIVLSLAIIFPLSRCVQRHTSQQMRCLGAIVSHSEEKISNIKTVKAFNAEKQEYRSFMDRIGHLFKAAITTTLFSATMNFIAVGSMGSLILLMVNRSATLVLDGTMKIGDVTSLLMYTALIGGSIQSFTSSIAGIQKCIGAAASVASYIDNQGSSFQAKQSLIPKAPTIEFKNVSFAYPSRPDSPIIKNVSFILPAGSTLVVFGESGCGKSSIIQLLLGLYQPTTGAICIDEKDMEHINLEDLRHMTGWVEQQGTLFNDTIRQNVLYGQENTNIDLSDAYTRSGLSQVIDSLPHGEDTKVGQLGKTLSGGQRQRVSLARMFARDPKLVLLDEASAALDMDSEQKLNDALSNFLRNRTALIVSHRISLLTMADYVMVMNAGTIAQFGTKEQVLQFPCEHLSKMLAAA